MVSVIATWGKQGTKGAWGQPQGANLDLEAAKRNEGPVYDTPEQSPGV